MQNYTKHLMDVQAWVFTNLCYFNCIDIDYSMVQFKASETTNYISIFNIFEFQSASEIKHEGLLSVPTTVTQTGNFLLPRRYFCLSLIFH